MRALSNPFFINNPEVTGHVSCRGTEIEEIVTGSQNALIIAGTPTIGKTTLIHYLTQSPSSSWSWRSELNETGQEFLQTQVEATRFVQIDVEPLLLGGDFSDMDELLGLFITQCTKALRKAYTQEEYTSTQTYTSRELYKLLFDIRNNETSSIRYFLILDDVEPLGTAYKPFQEGSNEKKTDQEFGLSLLDHCGAIRIIVDILDKFKMVGFILSIESLPRARVANQFAHISLDLARFMTKTLQVFTLNDTKKFLAQKSENFNHIASELPNQRSPSDETLFSLDEQELILQLAGTHPYLLQVCCYYFYQFKISIQKSIETPLEKDQLLSIINERISSFPSNTWKRLHEAINNSTDSSKIEEQFNRFVSYCNNKLAGDKIEYSLWDSFDPELRYILYSEGIVRYDLLQPIYFPGTILRDYLVQQVEVERGEVVESKPEREHILTIIKPGTSKKQIPLSRLEYRLLKTLIEHADYCTDQELIQSGWERGTERANLTQRLYKLRNKLKEQLDNKDIIENRYGGIYSLTHPQWLHID